MTSSHCLRCNSDGCIKCSAYLMIDNRQCVERCPSGYIGQWSTHTEYMGRICIITNGYSGTLLAALSGIFIGVLLCLSILIIALMIIKQRKRRKTIKQKLINENAMDRSDFLRQLNEMRNNAEYFLAMLNNTRRQIRKLYLSGSIASANSYRPIIRDLARILILLNRPIELIPAPPHDWHSLYTWADQALEYYKSQMGPMINFLQTSSQLTIDVDDCDINTIYHQKLTSNNYYESHPTLKLENNSNMNSRLNTNRTIKNRSVQLTKKQLFGSLVSLHEMEEPRLNDTQDNRFGNILKNANLLSDLNASSLWLEDEFYKLGFRPQDEITTEL